MAAGRPRSPAQALRVLGAAVVLAPLACGSGHLDLFASITGSGGAAGAVGGSGGAGGSGRAGASAGSLAGAAGAPRGAGEPRVSVAFRTSGYQLLADNSFSPVVSAGSDIYFVWVDASFHPQVTKISASGTATARLDLGDDYTARDDGVHKFSLGVDADGYIHVTGDMHHHPVSNSDHLPARYQGSRILYWVSDAPGTIDRFTFVGHDAARAVPGYAFSYGAFHIAPDGTLYYLARIRVHEGGHLPGEIGLALYRYSTVSRNWTALGALAPSDPPAVYASVLWEDDGEEGTFFQGLRANIRFDPAGRMHLAAALNADQSVAAPTHVVYAASDDGGQTFRRADGSAITALPLRVEAVPGQADVVEGPVADLDLFASPFHDAARTPAVAYTRDSISYYRYFQPEVGTWSAAVESPVGGVLRLKHFVGPDGILTFIEQSGRVERTTGFGVPGVEHTLLVDGRGIWLHAIDEARLRRDGVWIAVYALRDTDEMGVLRIDWN